MKCICHLSGFVITVVLTVSCSSTFYDVAPVPDKTKCDTTIGRLNFRIVNAGKIGISSVQVDTDSGYITLPGVAPGDTSCYFALPPLFKRPGYKISSFRLRSFRKPYLVTFSAMYLDHSSHKKLSSGFHTMTIELGRKKNNRKIDIIRAFIE